MGSLADSKIPDALHKAVVGESYGRSELPVI